MANTIAEPDTQDLNETETETQDEGQWRLKRRKEGGIPDHKRLIYTLHPRFALRCLHLQTMFEPKYLLQIILSSTCLGTLKFSQKVYLCMKSIVSKF
jgi:hypothetical protein